MNDLTFNNELINKYFAGDDSYIPVGELIWLHEHPLYKPNFLVQLEDMVLKAGKIIIKNNLANSHIIKKYEDAAIKLGQALGIGIITYENGPTVLAALRNAYNISKDIIEKLGSVG